MNRTKLLIDTDMGADVDDSLAVYAATKYPEVELVGITTVSGNVWERGRLVKKLLSLLGVDVPVYCGCPDTVEKPKNKEAHTMFFEEDLLEERYTPDEGGVEFIIECAKKYKKDLTVLAIGPLTNVALAIKKAPEVMAQVGRIVLMGGTFFSATPEWNIFCDPVAAEIVFGSGIETYCLGTDVTRKTRLPFHLQEEVVGYASEDGARGLVGKHAKAWMDTRKYAITLHDPLALYAIIRPKWLHFKKQRIAVECVGSAAYGMTVNCSLTGLYPKQKGNEVFVADYVDEQAVIDEMMACLRR